MRNSEEVPLAGNVGGRSGRDVLALPDRGRRARVHPRRTGTGRSSATCPSPRRTGCSTSPPTTRRGSCTRATDPWIQRVRRAAGRPELRRHGVAWSTATSARCSTCSTSSTSRTDTIVFFTGDNGGQDRFRSSEHPRGFFGPNVDPRTGAEFRGGKGNLYEGGLRIPFLARWPGKIDAGQVSDLVFYQPDVLPTLAELCSAEVPADVDGVSILPTLLGSGQQRAHEFFYWEFGSQLAVRVGDWKGLLERKGGGDWSQVLAEGRGTWSLFDLGVDPSEAHDRASEHPQLLREFASIAAREFTPARPGRYRDPQRTRHERDRWAKWGTAKDRPRSRGRNRPHRIEAEDLLDRSGWTLLEFSSQNEANGKLAANAIDGDPGTVWHSAFSHDLARPPHQLVLDLGAPVMITELHYLARQDNGWNGAFGEVELRGALDRDGLEGEPLATGEFQKVRTSQGLKLAVPTRSVTCRFAC